MANKIIDGKQCTTIIVRYVVVVVVVVVENNMKILHTMIMKHSASCGRVGTTSSSSISKQIKNKFGIMAVNPSQGEEGEGRNLGLIIDHAFVPSLVTLFVLQLVINRPRTKSRIYTNGEWF